MVQTKWNQEEVAVTKICFYGKKMKVGAIKIQLNGSDKKEIRQKRLILKYNYSFGKMK